MEQGESLISAVGCSRLSRKKKAFYAKNRINDHVNETFKGMRQLVSNNDNWARSGKFMEQEETGRGLKKWSRGA